MPPWHLLTLVPHASPASVRPLMRPSHAGRQIRETRLPASCSNWSPPQQDPLLLRAAIGGPQREATSTSSVIAGILAWLPSRPSSFRGRPQPTPYNRVPPSAAPSAGIFQIPKRTGLVPEAWSHVLPRSPIAPTMQWRHPGEAAAYLLLFQCDARPHTVPRPGGCDAPQGFEAISAKPTISAMINPALPRVQSNKPQPCWPHVTPASAWVWGQPPSLSDASGRSAGEEAQVRTTSQPDSLSNLYWPKKSFFGKSAIAISAGSLAFSFGSCRNRTCGTS